MLADRREVVSRRIEYILPSGTNGVEVTKTLGVAETEYRAAHDMGRPCHEFLRVEARDDEIVVSFVVETGANR